MCRLSVAGPTDLDQVVFRIVDQSRYAEVAVSLSMFIQSTTACVSQVLDLLYTNFHTDEPMSRALKIFDGSNRIPEADDFTLRALAENLSIMAVDSVTNKLLGVAVNGVVKKDSFPQTREEVTTSVNSR